MALNNTKEDKIFASVLADGKIHVSVPDGTEGAVIREYETSDGKTGKKTEFVYTEVSGVISKLEFFEGDFGKNLQLTIVDGDEKPVVLSLPTASNYGEDAMKKLLNVNMDKPVRIAPYSFTADNGKAKKGITIYQANDDGKEVKIENYFYDPVKEKNINGYPDVKFPKGKKTLSSDEWKLYFMQARMFLIEKITEHFKLDTVDSSVETDKEKADKDYDSM